VGRGTRFAPSITEAARRFVGIALYFQPLLVVSANAWIGDVEAELIYDSSPHTSEREFFQTFIPDEPDVPTRRSRIIDARATLSLHNALELHENHERIHRSASHYSLALNHWQFGQQTLALAFLFMGIEALVPVAIRVHCERQRVGEDEFAETLGVKLQANTDRDLCDRCRKRIQQQRRYEFYAAVRRKVLFDNDVETANAAKKASDGFEHGYESFDNIREFARSARDKTAGYLRKAILELSEMEKPDLTVLSESRFEKPFGPHPILHYFRGRLLGESDQLAADGEEYPRLGWELRITAVDESSTGGTSIQTTQTQTASLGPNIQLRPESIEGWDANELLPAD
jgi:hypothetical protein